MGVASAVSTGGYTEGMWTTSVYGVMITKSCYIEHNYYCTTVEVNLHHPALGWLIDCYVGLKLNGLHSCNIQLKQAIN